MRIKKKTKALMLAASAVAVAGVAAVSFAAWTGSNSNQAAKAETGSAYLFGFSETTTEKTFSGDLVPYDQPNETVENGVKVVSLALPTYEVFGAYEIKVTCVQAANLSYYAFVGNQVTAMPAGWNPTSAVGDWQVVDADGATFSFADAQKGEVAADSTYVNLMLVSDTQNTKDAMNQETSFNIELINKVQA